MSDTFDHALDAYESMYYDYGPGYDDSSKDCKYCGTEHLKWEQVTTSNGTGWRLVDPTTGEVHRCNEFLTRKENELKQKLGGIKMEKLEALKKYLMEYEGFSKEDVEEIKETEDGFEIGDREYIVLTEDEAAKKVAEEIENSYWAFNSSFLAQMTDLPEEVYIALQPQCESSNDAVARLVERTCGKEVFVEEAVSVDGRGHFISRYDGNENEYDEHFIYRVN